MPFPFSVSVTPIAPVPEDETDLSGEDISLTQGKMEENQNGDLATVTGPLCARQSVIREFTANPNELTRRPQWGVGLPGLLFKGVTNSVKDKITSRGRARLLANRRVARVHEVTVTSTTSGTQTVVRADVVGGYKDETIVIKPPGVQ